MSISNSKLRSFIVAFFDGGTTIFVSSFMFPKSIRLCISSVVANFVLNSFSLFKTMIVFWMDGAEKDDLTGLGFGK